MSFYYLNGSQSLSKIFGFRLKSKLEGGTYENKFFVMDTKMQWSQPAHQIIPFPSKTNFCIFFPMYLYKEDLINTRLNLFQC